MTPLTHSTLLNNLMYERRALVVRISSLVIFFVCLSYAYLWYLLGIPVLSWMCCVVTLMAIIFWRHERLKIPQTWAIQGLITTAVLMIYLTSLYTWHLSVAALAYFPVVIVGTFLLSERKSALAWTAVDVILVLTLPWIGSYLTVEVLPLAFITFYNTTNAVTVLVVTSAIVYLFENLSRSMIVELVNIKTTLEATQQRLIEAQQQRNRFFTSISHEIRTPMNAVRGISELLSQDKALMETEGTLISALHRSSNHLLSVVNDLLDVSKLEVGPLRLVEADFDLHESIQDAYTIALYAAEEKHLQFDFEIAPQVPRYAFGDANRLRQVIVNLLNNAVKFTHKGTVFLTCHMVPSPQPNTVCLRVVIQDTGIGIAASMQEKIFDEYTQVDDNLSRTYGGTGLGLNIVKRILQQQGGTIRVDSVLGQGSTFCFELPLHVAKSAIHSAAQIKGDVPPSDAFIETPLTILVVEDNSINVLVVKSLINAKLRHITFLVAENGEVALSLLEAGHVPDLILMDMQMPVMDGIEATKRIRSHSNPLIANLNIIAMTANIAPEDVALCSAVGMNDFIPKPIDSTVLILKIRHFIQNKVAPLGAPL
jgi:signal transduction histidine kinase